MKRTCLAIALALACTNCDKKTDEPSSTDAAEVSDQGSDQAGSTGETGSTAGQENACISQPQPNGMPSGIERCDPSVAWNRTEAETCAESASLPPEDDGCVDPCMSFAVPGVCRDGTEITGEPFCHYECQTDADCGEGAACICAFEGMHGFNQCVDATCRSDADCGAGSCGLSVLCNLVSTLQCRTDC